MWCAPKEVITLKKSHIMYIIHVYNVFISTKNFIFIKCHILKWNINRRKKKCQFFIWFKDVVTTHKLFYITHVHDIMLFRLKILNLDNYVIEKKQITFKTVSISYYICGISV